MMLINIKMMSQTKAILATVAVSIGVVLIPAWVSAAQEMPQMPEAISSESLNIDIFSDISIEKTGDKTEIGTNGQVTFQIKVTNHGPNDASSVSAVDQLPLALEFVSSDRSGYDSFTGVWSIGAMKVGQTEYLHIAAKAKSGFEGEVTNTASVTATGQVDKDTSNNFSSVKVNVLNSAENGGADPGSDTGTPPFEGKISGVVFLDENGDGVRQDSESAVPGVTVYLDANNDSVLQIGVETSDVSFDDGTYELFLLAADTYKVRQIVPSEKTETLPGVSKNYYHEVIVSNENREVGDIDFGFTDSGGQGSGGSGQEKVGEISGIIWLDANQNGLKENDEEELSGWTVFIDVDSDGVKDEGEEYRVTASPFVFSGIADGSYRLTLEKKDGYTVTYPADGAVFYNVTILGQNQKLDANFGVYAAPTFSGGSGSSSSSGSSGGGVAPGASQSSVVQQPSQPSAAPVGQVLGESTQTPGPGLSMSDITPLGNVMGVAELPRTGASSGILVLLLGLVFSLSFLPILKQRSR